MVKNGKNSKKKRRRKKVKKREKRGKKVENSQYSQKRSIWSKPNKNWSKRWKMVHHQSFIIHHSSSIIHHPSSIMIKSTGLQKYKSNKRGQVSKRDKFADKQTNRHINTMTLTGLRARPSENRRGSLIDKDSPPTTSTHLCISFLFFFVLFFYLIINAFFNETKNYTLHPTREIWNVIPDMWHVTCDTQEGGWNFDFTLW